MKINTSKLSDPCTTLAFEDRQITVTLCDEGISIDVFDMSEESGDPDNAKWSTWKLYSEMEEL